MSLDIVVRSERGATVLGATGDIDVQTASTLHDALAGATAEGSAGDVVLDLAGTNFLDSSALGVLIGFNKKVESGPGHFTVVCDKPHLLRVFEITRLGEVLRIVATLDAALA